MPESELEAIFVNWRELIHCNRKLVKCVAYQSHDSIQDYLILPYNMGVF